jgi:hypothetical protein
MDELFTNNQHSTFENPCLTNENFYFIVYLFIELQENFTKNFNHVLNAQALGYVSCHLA